MGGVLELRGDLTDGQAQQYVEHYTQMHSENPERRALERLWFINKAYYGGAHHMVMDDGRIRVPRRRTKNREYFSANRVLPKVLKAVARLLAVNADFTVSPMSGAYEDLMAAGVIDPTTQRVTIATDDPLTKNISDLQRDPDGVVQRGDPQYVYQHGYRRAVPTSPTGVSEAYGDGEFLPHAGGDFGLEVLSTSASDDDTAGTNLTSVDVTWVNTSWVRATTSIALAGTVPVAVTASMLYVESLVPTVWQVGSTQSGTIVARRTAADPLGGLNVGADASSGMATVAVTGEQLFLMQFQGHTMTPVRLTIRYATDDVGAGPSQFGHLWQATVDGPFNFDLRHIQPPTTEEHAYWVEAEAVSSPSDVYYTLTIKRV